MYSKPTLNENDAIKEREQAYFKIQLKKNSKNLSQSVDEAFEDEYHDEFYQAINIVKKSVVNNSNVEEKANEDTFNQSKEELINAINLLYQQVSNDRKKNIISANTALSIGVAIKNMVLTGDTVTFKTHLHGLVPVKKMPVWQKIIALVMTAAIGFFAGLMIGTGAGPVAAGIALASGAKGALIGSNAGALVGLLTGCGALTLFKPSIPYASATSSAVLATHDLFAKGVPGLGQ